MKLDYLRPDELRDVLAVVANAFEDHLRVEQRMSETGAFLEVAAAVNLGRAVAANRRLALQQFGRPQLEVVS